MPTSHTRNAQPGSGAQRLRVKVRGHRASGARAGGDGRRRRSILIEAGLIVLVVSTTWAIASVSVWCVPLYLALLVMIFVTPQVWRLSPFLSESDAASDGVGITDLAQGLRVDRADGAEQYRPVTRSDAHLETGESALSSDPDPDVTTAGTAKQRRGRGRTRKAAKPAAELVPDSIPVAWIQVGPGKFVRIEGGIQAADSAQAEETAPRDLPATVTSTEATTAVTAQAEPLAEQEPSRSPETSPGDMAPVLVSADCATGSVTEEYGIAPSAFSRSPRLSRIPRGIVRTVPRADRASWRHDMRACRKPRALIGSSFAPNTPRQNAVFRAFGRMAHVGRGPRPRSPPGRTR